MVVIERGEIDYPSGENPRQAVGLTPDAPKIMELAKSIERYGLQYSPILYKKADGRYEAIDGDRRLVACFDLLGWTEIDAIVREVESRTQLYYLKLAANWDREDFSGLEKGRYIYAIVEEEMAADNLNIEENWGNREIRNEYLRRVSNMLAKPVSLVSRYVNAWLQVPKEDRGFIAKSRDELGQGKLSISKASDILKLGRKLDNVEQTWRVFVPLSTMREKKPPVITSKELEVTKRAIDAGRIKTVAQLKEFKEKDSAADWSQLSLLIKREEEQTAAKIAAALNTEISKVYRGCVLLGAEHLEELANIVIAL